MVGSEGKYTGAVLMDLAKTFDIVDHNYISMF